MAATKSSRESVSNKGDSGKKMRKVTAIKTKRTEAKRKIFVLFGFFCEGVVFSSGL